MSAGVHRQPWFWAVLAAVAALLVFAVVILASDPDREGEDSTTIVQQPSPAPETQLIPVPNGSTQPAPQPAQPAPQPAPPPQIIREREKTVIIREKESDGPEPSGTAGASPDQGMNRDGTEEFRSTGLPKELQFDNSRWRAVGTQTIDDPARLKPVEMPGAEEELFVSVNAQPPFRSVLVPVPDQEGSYVEYRRG